MAKQRVPLRPGESSGPQPPGSDLPPVNGSPPVEPPGQGADKKPERRYVGRLPTRVALENETAGNPSEPIAILMGMLSVFGILFCLLLEVIDVRRRRSDDAQNFSELRLARLVCSRFSQRRLWSGDLLSGSAQTNTEAA
jgi:hypothetical protein